MTRRGPKKNLAASIRERLLQLSKERGEDFGFILTRYGMERLLYRLAKSEHAPAFVLKGATLFTLWSGSPHRATRDLDLLGRGEPSLDVLAETFRALCEAEVEDDGLVFDPATVEAARIKEDANYEGVRVTLEAKLGNARIPIQVDIGFGDAVTPRPEVADFPTLLPLPAPRLRVYPRETVIAEKLQAMVELGIANSRMKDFFDICFLARHFTFDGRTLSDAIRATFERRRTAIPATDPIGLTSAFAEDAQKKIQWIAFIGRSRLATPAFGLAEAVGEARGFVGPVLDALRRKEPFLGSWQEGAWQP